MGKYDKYLEMPTAGPGNRYEQFAAPPPPPPPPQDPLWYRALKTMDDAVRAGVDTASFGLFDKGLQAAGLEEDAVARTEQARKDSPYATIAGDVAGAMLPGAALSRGAGMIGGLAKNTIPRIMGREAIAGGAFTALDDAIRDQEFNPADIGATAAASGILGGGLAAASRLFPMGRIRAAGVDLEPSDKNVIEDFMRQSGDKGVKLNIAEAATAKAPGRARGVESMFDTATMTSRGNTVAGNMDAARKGGILAAGSDMVKKIGPGTGPLPVKEAAGSAIKGRVDDLMTRNAEPLYKKAEPVKVPPIKPKGAAIRTSEQAVMRDPVKKEAFATKKGKKLVPGDNIRWYDAVKKELDSQIAAAEKNSDSTRLGLLVQAKDRLTKILDTASPDYAMARSEASKALAEGDRLGAGPLGAMSRSEKGATQGSALFGASNAAERDAAAEAIRMLPQGMPRSILSNVVGSAVSKGDLNFGSKVLPTPEAKDLAKMAMAADYPNIQEVLDAVTAVRPAPGTGSVERIHDIASIFRKAGNLGSGRLVEKMYDPATAQQLGEIGPVLGPLLRGSTAATGQADILRPEKKDRRKKKKKGDKKDRSWIEIIPMGRGG